MASCGCYKKQLFVVLKDLNELLKLRSFTKPTEMVISEKNLFLENVKKTKPMFIILLSNKISSL